MRPHLPRLPFTQETWRRRTEWPITIAALVFLVVYAWSVLADLRGGLWEAAEWVMWAVWLVFVADYLVLLALAERRLHWFVTHLPQFLVVALPMLRPLRLLRLLTLFTLLRRATGAWFRGRVTVYVVGSAALLVLLASLAELEAERHAPRSGIRTFGDALWWSFETVTTVGYGDRTPVTGEGRLIAVGLMIAGIALLGVITATFASWLVQRVAEVDRASEAATVAHVEALAAEIRALRSEVAVLADRAGPGRPADAPR
ncbi:potassium channel family protein [Amnibacterium sp.]|uniref:potassium channel family protein n=1 Tax=Amnibacterium sp. TaxID=1872496 RepID=UPI002627D52A|nr:potassium channel family protein [Amnibacterium sp.]MCU1473838.1 ion transporter [Amnibacterium sp.]